jgi:hypothetical protein
VIESKLRLVANKRNSSSNGCGFKSTPFNHLRFLFEGHNMKKNTHVIAIKKMVIMMKKKYKTKS